MAVALKRLPAHKARQAKQEMAETREAKQRLKGNDYSYQLKLTKRVAQKLANRLDAYHGHGCISCDTQKTDIQYSGGHYKTGGGFPELAVDLRNIHRQCNRNCNESLSGNIHGTKTSGGYIKGLVARYGQQYVDWLDGPHSMQQFTCDTLKAIRKEYAAEIRRIEAGQGPSRNWRELKEPRREAA